VNWGLREDRRTPEGRARTRSYAKLSISAAVVLLVFGVVLVFVLPRATAGLICVVFSGIALLVWAFLLPYYGETGSSDVAVLRRQLVDSRSRCICTHSPDPAAALTAA
jgi:hypothetical protein